MQSVGFIGLGSMGSAMALNLARAGTKLIVWNRSPGKAAPLARDGAHVAADAGEVFACARTVILMLADEAAIDAVLARGAAGFAARVAGRMIVHMGTTAPAYSRVLDAAIREAGGRYVEAPVSGSRKPAEAGELVAMLAGEDAAIAAIRPLLAPLCRKIVTCGAVPNALVMKLAVNIFLLATVTGLAESLHFAEQSGLDLDQVGEILDTGQMASEISRLKTAKLVQRDFAAHAAIVDVKKNARLIADAASEAAIAAPLLDVCRALYDETCALGHGQDDMIAVVAALEARTQARRTSARTRCSD